MATPSEKIQARRKEIRDILGEELTAFSESIATEIREDLIVVVIEILRQLQLIPPEGEEPRVGEPLPGIATLVQALPFPNHKFTSVAMDTTLQSTSLLADHQISETKFIIVEVDQLTQLDFDANLAPGTPQIDANLPFGTPLNVKIIHFQSAVAGTLRIWAFW